MKLLSSYAGWTDLEPKHGKNYHAYQVERLDENSVCLYVTDEFNPSRIYLSNEELQQFIKRLQEL